MPASSFDSAAPRVEQPLVVAVDGPSGSGKSSVSREVATRLGVRYLDTGAMYRALTWWVLEQGLDPADPAQAATVAEAAVTLPLEMVADPASTHVMVGDTDVSAAIREPRISAAVSAVATNLDVRATLVDRQQALVQDARTDGTGIVVEGRDITTVVAPDADVRVLLTASEAARLARRALEVHGSDDAQAIDATRDHVVGRDAQDATVADFLEAGEGVTVVDSSMLSFEQTVQAVLELVEEKR